MDEGGGGSEIGGKFWTSFLDGPLLKTFLSPHV